MTITALPDPEVMTRQWLIDDPDIFALVGTNVATTLPYNPPFPFVVVELVQTIRIPGEPLLVESWMQVDVYAGKNDYRTASSVARSIYALGDTWRGRVVPSHGETAYVYGMRSQNMRRIPEPETNWARYMLDIVFIMRRD